MRVGVSFHVGSQQRDLGAWDDALGVVAGIASAAAASGVELSFVNLGGGFPGTYVDATPSVDDYGPPVLPELQQIPPSLVQCFYGEDEADTLCTNPSLAGAKIVRTSGGHHFDGDYKALAERILEGAKP